MSHSGPVISIVTPLFNPPPSEFRACIDSVFDQTSKNWQWCLTDDGSTKLPAKELERLERHPQVVVAKLPSNQGIAAATNDALGRATGDFVTFLDQDDELAENAIEVVQKFVSKYPDTDVFYSDEDKIDQRGRYFDLFPKPKWSPERLRHQNYFNHLTIVNRQLLSRIGNLRAGFDGSQDYDMVLRATEVARNVRRIPHILYHWRTIPTSVAADPRAKPQAHVAACKAVQEHFERLGIEAEVSVDNRTFCLNVERKSKTFPKVSILIPSRGSSARIDGTSTVLIENCIESILQLSSYPDYEIVVILDASCPGETLEYLRTRDPQRIRIVDFHREFNYSAKINLGAVTSSGDVLIPLNDDTQVVTPDWIEQLLVYFVEPDVGVTAPLLLLEDGKVQSAGHYFKDGPHHFAPGKPQDWGEHHGLLSFPSERTGVTFACAAVPRDVFDLVGGLSEQFPRAFNDVDFCNKVRQAGYRIIWTPQSILYHFESKTRDPKVDASEVQLLYDRWGRLVRGPDEVLLQVALQHL